VLIEEGYERKLLQLICWKIRKPAKRLQDPVRAATAIKLLLTAKVFRNAPSFLTVCWSLQLAKRESFTGVLEEEFPLYGAGLHMHNGYSGPRPERPILP
jgi:hypothetical protein